MTENKILNIGFVIDCQNDFIDGVLGTPEAKAMIPKLAKWIKDFDGKIFATRDTHFSNYMDTMEGSTLKIPHCISGSEGWNINEEIHEALENSKNGITPETFIDKVGFAYDEWYDTLDIIDIKASITCGTLTEINLHFTGLCTDICVVSNMLTIMGIFQALKIPTSTCRINFYVHKELCAGTTVANHEAALTTMGMCHAKVV